MQDTMTTDKQMTSEQQAQLLQFTKVGLQWVAGQISFDDVIKRLGKPQYQSEQADLIKYAYYPEDVMSVYFLFDKLHPVDGKPAINAFQVKVGDGVHTNIPYERFDSLGLQRLVRGESIDGVRVEQRDFFAPAGIADVSGFYPDNFFGFNFRLPLPPDSLFDVYAGFGYLGQWKDEHGIPDLSNVRQAVDLRNLGISRHYLTPEEQEQRRLAKRKKYGDMNLRTGMICPETGYWEAWTENGMTECYVWEKGYAFNQARSLPVSVQMWSTGVDARWMWRGEYDPEKPFGAS